MSGLLRFLHRHLGRIVWGTTAAVYAYLIWTTWLT